MKTLKEKIIEILENRTWVWSGEFTDKYYELIADELLPLFSQSQAEQVKAMVKMVKKEIKGSLENQKYQEEETKNKINTEFWKGCVFGEKLILSILKKRQ